MISSISARLHESIMMRVGSALSLATTGDPPKPGWVPRPLPYTVKPAGKNSHIHCAPTCGSYHSPFYFRVHRPPQPIDSRAYCQNSLETIHRLTGTIFSY